MRKQIQIGSNLTPQQINHFVDRALETMEDASEMHVDMTDCRYLNSMMLAGLIRLLKKCRQRKVELVLTNVSTSAYMLFETTNVLELFRIDQGTLKENDSVEFSADFSALNDSQGIFKLRGSMHQLQQCSSFRDLYEEKLSHLSDCVLDCTELMHLGSSGVTEMFRLRGLLKEKGGNLIIVSHTDSVESIWRMMHLSSLIPKVTDLEAALKMMREWAASPQS